MAAHSSAKADSAAANEKLNQQLIQYAKSRDTRLRDRIIAGQLPLVHRLARAYHVADHDNLEDLVQVGSIGLLHAVERFNPSQGVTFKTYATHLIVGEIKHYLRDHSAMIRPPRELQEISSKVGRGMQELSIRLGRDPNDQELADFLQIPVEKIRELMISWQRSVLVSLDQELGNRDGGDSDASLIQYIEDKKYKSFHLAQEDAIIFNQAMERLRGQSREVIEFAFFHDLTQTEIAKHLGISQMQVSRRLKTALGELWKSLNTRVTPW